MRASIPRLPPGAPSCPERPLPGETRPGAEAAVCAVWGRRGWPPSLGGAGAGTVPFPTQENSDFCGPASTLPRKELKLALKFVDKRV